MLEATRQPPRALFWKTRQPESPSSTASSAGYAAVCRELRGLLQSQR